MEWVDGFSFHAPSFREALFVNPDISLAVLLDHRTCDTRYPFAYTLYTREQNALMHKYRGAAGDAPQYSLIA